MVLVSKKHVIDQMKALGTYKAEYDDVISIYVDMLKQYALFMKQFKDSGYQVSEEYTNKAGATNQRKVPVLTALETLRKEIITYSDRLQLNPKAAMIDAVNDKPAANALDQFLKAAGRA
ncbi:P27 family phage terminase small subunit [Lacticaseibacillus paracasei]|uniref:P27 family phage terminase small subunit n=1 Tax=Lacticaseibacillus paracasei NRIC 0644 TaxID=1435038 RepID=A0A0C9NWW3_LACPA|nr:P27 family phage terminase small subunit [Lacticaseibacillus paracasei]GAN36465.1 hypothetical protein LC0644_1054 [Lacticaseibacillus paracasei NRIC 0644]GAN39232.1 hypothetical protein LC1917_1109 [Lacticaseibacillus paracasei NRIC 1917]